MGDIGTTGPIQPIRALAVEVAAIHLLPRMAAHRNGMNKFDVFVIHGGSGGTPAALGFAAGDHSVLPAGQCAGPGGSCFLGFCIPVRL